MKDLIYKSKVLAIGRNGMIIQKGLGITMHSDGTRITLNPINSKNMLSNCQVEIPVEDISMVIKALNDFNIDPLIIDDSEVNFLNELSQIQEIKCPKCGKQGFFEPIDHSWVVCEYCDGSWNIAKLKDGFYIKA